jgi:hypothetical protein
MRVTRGLTVTDEESVREGPAVIDLRTGGVERAESVILGEVVIIILKSLAEGWKKETLTGKRISRSSIFV